MVSYLSDKTYDNIYQCHNAIVGHGGFKRTITKLKLLNYFWPNMRLDFKIFIRDAKRCLKLKFLLKLINMLHRHIDLWNV